MDQLRYGLFPYPPYLFATAQSDLAGYLSTAYKAMNYYLLEKFNITFVATTPRAGAYCDQSGNCFSALRDLQSGKVDVEGFYGTNYLSSVAVNLTIASPVIETKCFVFYKPEVRPVVSSEYFFDFVHYFDPVFWLLLIILVIIFFLLCKFLHVYLVNSWYQLTWTLIGTTLGQFTCQPVGQLSRRCFYIGVFLGFLLIGSIFSASLQTGLKSTFDFVKLNNLNDVIDQNYTVQVIDTVTCAKLFDFSSTLNKIKWNSRQLVLINATNKNPYELFESAIGPGRSIVDENLQYLRMKHFSCWFNRQNELTSPIYISKHSILKVVNLGVYHSGINPRTGRLIERYSYSASEMGCVDNHHVRKLGLFAEFNEKGSSSCMASEVKVDSIITSSISLEYLMVPAIILYTGHLVSLIIFIYGHWST